MKVLGLIPARGGSKGVPGKNGKLLNGRPLLAYTIDVALKVEGLSKVVFSSEDPHLIDLAKQEGAVVPFMRPQELATDQATSLSVVQHALKQLQQNGETYDAVCLLQVTTPFRSVALVEQAIDKFIQSGYDSLISVQAVPHQYNPHWVFELSGEGTDSLQLATKDDQIISRRQELPPAYIRDGSIYLTKTEVLLEQDSFFGTNIGYVVSDSETFINIDTAADWTRAEEIARSNT